MSKDAKKNYTSKRTSSSRKNSVAGSNALKVQGNYSAYKKDLQTKQTLRVAESNLGPISERLPQAKSNTAYTIVLIFAIIATVAVTMLLLKTQFEVTAASERVIDIQKELVLIKKSNELLSTEINQSINMNEVYEVATTELGMIQPTSDHISYVETTERSYTVQYDTINVPEDEAEVTIGNVLGFIH